MDDRAAERFSVVLSALTFIGIVVGFAAPYVGWAALSPLGFGLVYLAGGVPTARRALKSLWHERSLDIDLLMIIAALAAAGVGAPAEGAILLFLFSLSTTLETLALGRARREVEALMGLRPETALRKTGADVEEVQIAQLEVDDVVVVRPGAKIPVDGIVLSGEGEIDESTVTGESMPVSKAPGAKVFEATVNQSSVLEMRVSATMSDSTVARMIQLVTEAQAARAPSERFSAWFGQRYTIGVLAGAVIALAIFLWLGREWSDAAYRAAVVLVAASPCALVISVPAAILSALSAAARGGVLFKGGAALETFAAVSQFAFDKTGTLTTGRAEVTGIISLGMPEDDFLSLVSGLEAHSEHPIAAAVHRTANKRGLAPASVSDVVTRPSEGITGRDAMGMLWAGNRRMAARMGVDVEKPAFAALLDEAETVIWVGRGARILGAVAVADSVRASSRPALDQLREAGIDRIAMMTGDRRPVALRIGAELGLSPDEIHSDLLPEDKVHLVGEMAKAGKVAFVGDGVNDAAALARAEVGIAMGAAGSDVALEAADVALLSEDMARLPAAHGLARRAARIIRQNLVFAMGAMLVLVSGALFFELPLTLAVIGHEGGTVLVVMNGLRLLFDSVRSVSSRSAAIDAVKDVIRPQEIGRAMQESRSCGTPGWR
ncbi:MAG: cation-translocating P-type ATPase [Hyphomicrobiaceae bacterium]|nr:cation-translocating P-type ATPase [Hyphomicrobiaceae bacterium]